MTAQRLLPGLKRTGPHTWQWGQWDISRIPESACWLAFDTAFDRLPDDDKTDDNLSRYHLVSFDARYFVTELYTRGPNPVMQEAAR